MPLLFIMLMIIVVAMTRALHKLDITYQTSLIEPLMSLEKSKSLIRDK